MIDITKMTKSLRNWDNPIYYSKTITYRRGTPRWYWGDFWLTRRTLSLRWGRCQQSWGVGWHVFILITVLWGNLLSVIFWISYDSSEHKPLLSYLLSRNKLSIIVAQTTIYLGNKRGHGRHICLQLARISDRARHRLFLSRAICLRVSWNLFSTG